MDPQSAKAIPGIQFKWQDPHVSQPGGALGPGRSTAESSAGGAAYDKGCKFDGWSDQFNYSLWQEAITESEAIDR